MRRVSWNLASCHATVQKLLIRQFLTISMVWDLVEAMRDRQCALSHDATESALIVSGVINKPTTVQLCILPVYRRLAVAKFSKSTMYKLLTWPWPRPLREHPLITRLRLCMADPYTKSKSLALAVAEILHGVENSKTGYLTLTTPFSGKIFLQQGGTRYDKSVYQIWSL